MPKTLFIPLQLSLGAFACLYTTPLLAQVTSDGTVNTQVNQNGNTSEIIGGQTRGSNLFHSFQNFSLPTGNEAFFNNADSISNIFSRVTGGNISNIDGLIRANGDASLFLINPAGIIFGENARLDIGGSFYGSTADSILFEDGQFSAVDNLAQPILTINAPIGLSLRDSPRDIVNRSFVQNDAGEFVGLEVAPRRNITLLGGNINFEAGEITASGGNIELGGLSEAGTVGINEDGSLSFPAGISKADLNLNNATDIDASGTGGGNITINARNLTLSAGEFGNSLIRAGITADSTSNEAQAGNIKIDAGENIVINNSGIQNTVANEGRGNAGNIIINTNSLEAINGGQINASTFGRGNAGAIEITATGDIIVDGEDLFGFPSSVASQVNSGAMGDAGGVVISTNNLNLTNGGSIDASTLGEGNAGAINITATGDITADGETSQGFRSGVISGVATEVIGEAVGITISTTNLNLFNGGIVSASTFGRGNAGAINITATGDITVDGEDSAGFSSGVGSQVNPGAVGDTEGVSISTNNLNLTNGGRVTASTLGEGNAGAINITATGDITADGENSQGFISDISSRVGFNAVGDAGGVTISTNNLLLTNGGSIAADTFGQGNAGAINITAIGDITADGEDFGSIPSGITSGVSPNAVGDSGGVTISTTNLSLIDGGRVDASTFGQGNAGAIDITATGDITADGESSQGFVSAVASQVNPSAAGDARGVTISATNLNLIDGGRVDATTGGEGNAGAINITAIGDITADGENSNGVPSAIVSQVVPGAVGNAGGVTISTTNLNLTNGGSVNASTLGEGNAGNVTIDADRINLISQGSIETATQSATGVSGIINLQVTEDITLRDNSLISARAFEEADGGNLNIDARFIVAFPDGNNDIIANAQQGNGGIVNINAESLFGIEERPLNSFTNDINASSEFSLDGNVTINTADFNPIQGSTELPSNVIVPEETIRQACEANREIAAKNGFTINGKGGIVPEPGLPLNSQNIIVDGDAYNSAIPAPIKTAWGEIQPARGIKVSKSGEIILTAYRTNNAGDRLPEINPNCDRD